MCDININRFCFTFSWNRYFLPPLLLYFRTNNFFNSTKTKLILKSVKWLCSHVAASFCWVACYLLVFENKDLKKKIHNQVQCNLVQENILRLSWIVNQIINSSACAAVWDPTPVSIWQGPWGDLLQISGSPAVRTKSWALKLRKYQPSLVRRINLFPSK